MWVYIPQAVGSGIYVKNFSNICFVAYGTLFVTYFVQVVLPIYKGKVHTSILVYVLLYYYEPYVRFLYVRLQSYRGELLYSRSNVDF